MTSVCRLHDGRQEPNSRPYNPICKFSRTSSRSARRDKIPKLGTFYMQIIVTAGRQRPQEPVFPIGPPICDFFGGKCGPSICVQFPVKPTFPIGSRFPDRFAHRETDVSCKQSICLSSICKCHQNCLSRRRNRARFFLTNLIKYDII